MTAPTYVSPTAWADLPSSPVAAAAVMAQLTACSAINPTMQLFLLDAAGNETDITRYVVMGEGVGPVVTVDSTADVCESLRVRLTTALTWGSAQVRAYLLLSSAEYAAGQWQRAPRGTFVLTSPGTDSLDHAGYVDVSGFGRTYLLQSDLLDSLAWAAGSTYLQAVTDVFTAAGLLTGGAALSTIANYPGDWATKTLPTAINYPVATDTVYLQVANDLLEASGCRPLYTDPTGRFVIELVPNVQTQALLWTWEGSAVGTTTSPVRFGQVGYNGDVHGAANRWVFVQDNLTFDPVEGAGQYTVNDVSSGSPADQATVGRVVVDRVPLSASGQADLKTQGDAYVLAAKSEREKVSLTTNPWPVGWHHDVFAYAHDNLPQTRTRRVQAQSFTLPLDGRAQQWQTNVIPAVTS